MALTIIIQAAGEQADAAHEANMKKHLRREAERWVGEGMVDRIEVNPIPTLTADDKLVEAAEAVRQALISGDTLEELEVAYPDFAELVKEVAEVASMALTQHGMVDRICADCGADATSGGEVTTGPVVAISWTVEDITDVYDLSDEDAEAFLQSAKSALQDRSVSLGWDVLEDCAREQEIRRCDEISEDDNDATKERT